MAADEQGVPGNAAGERKQRVGVFVDVEVSVKTVIDVTNMFQVSPSLRRTQ